MHLDININNKPLGIVIPKSRDVKQNREMSRYHFRVTWFISVSDTAYQFLKLARAITAM